MRNRAVRAFGLATIILCLTISMSAAQWPATCVEINDTFEASHGNYENIGIYQRTFGDHAEQACRNDHRDDVQRAFAWALGEQLPTSTVTTPSPVSSDAERDFERVKKVATARGENEIMAATIALAVVTNGDVEAYLRGTLPAISSGAYPCPRRNDQCPLAPHPDFEVANWTWDKIQLDDMCWKVVTKLDIVNYLSEWLQFAWIDILIIYDDDYVIDRMTTSDFNVAPNSTGRLSVFKDVCDGLGPLINNLRFEPERI